MQQKMNTKNLMVSFVIIASMLLLVSTVSAFTMDNAPSDVDVYKIKVDGLTITGHNPNVVLVAGESISLDVYFKALMDDKDVTVTATLDTGKEKSEVSTKTSFRVAAGQRYVKSLTLDVPNELKDELTDDATLVIEVEGTDGDSATKKINFVVERSQYDSVVKSITVPTNVEAGDVVPVDFVIRNTGFYDLDDTYVTVSIPALGVEKTVYIGDLYSLEGERTYTTTVGNSSIITTVEGDEDNEDTLSGRVYMEVPYEARSGIYSVEVQISNDDLNEVTVRDLVISNDFSAGNVIVTSSRQNVATGEDAVYELVIVNPTDKLKVYRVVTESSEALSSSSNTAVLAVPAGSSKTVTVTANADAEGEYTFDVTVFSGEELSDVVTLTANVEGNAIGTGSPVVVLTIILAIIFLVLLVVLIVLLGKKPEKAEEFGESYY